jgi:hypothetical protein
MVSLSIQESCRRVTEELLVQPDRVQVILNALLNKPLENDSQLKATTRENHSSGVPRHGFEMAHGNGGNDRVAVREILIE